MAKNWLVKLRRNIHHYLIVNLVREYYNRVWGTHIGEGSRISLTVKMDKANPGGIYIGQYTAVAFEATLLTHDYVNSVHRDVRIGSYCFVGARAAIMPGVTVGDHCIIGTGAVVMRDVPPNSVVLGNPGRVMERDIMTQKWGKRVVSSSAAAPDLHAAE